MRHLIARIRTFVRESNEIFACHEVPKSRVFLLDQTRKQLRQLSLTQSLLFEQALTCAEIGINRAACVIAWTAFMDFFEHKIVETGLPKLHTLKPDWRKYGSVEALREHVPEFQLIDAAEQIGLISKNEKKALHGLLAKRNECAHPSDYEPSSNETIGYLAELLNRLSALSERRLV